MDFKVCFPTQSDEWQQLKDDMAKLQGDFAAQTELVGTLKTQLEESEAARKKVEDDFEAHKSNDVTALDTRIRALEDLKVESTQEKLTNVETELPEVLKAVAEFRTENATLLTKMGETENKMEKCKVDCEAFQVDLHQFKHDFETFNSDNQRLTGTINKFQEAIDRIDAGISAQKEMIDKKYSKLWNEVTTALDSMTEKHVGYLNEQLDRRTGASVTEVQNLIGYSLQIMAKVTAERRAASDKKNLILTWRNQAWVAARRRLGMIALTKFMRRRIYEPYQTWKVQTTYESTIRRITKEYVRRIPDVPTQIEQLGYPKQIAMLQSQLRKVEDEKASKDMVMDELQKSDAEKAVKFKALDEMAATLELQSAKMESQEGKMEEIQTQSMAIDGKTEECGNAINSINEKLRTEYAQNVEVQAMVKDVLLIWYSIKQLDATKSDKKDMEAFALESVNRERNAVRSEVAENQTIVNEELSSINGNVDKLGTQFATQNMQVSGLQEMLSNLAAFIEELVIKIAEMQGVEVPGRSDGAAGEDTNLNNMEDMNRWLNYAKGVVDASMDNFHAKQVENSAGGNRFGRRPKAAARPSQAGGQSRGPSNAQVGGDLGLNGARAPRR